MSSDRRTAEGSTEREAEATRIRELQLGAYNGGLSSLRPGGAQFLPRAFDQSATEQPLIPELRGVAGGVAIRIRPPSPYGEVELKGDAEDPEAPLQADLGERSLRHLQQLLAASTASPGLRGCERAAAEAEMRSLPGSPHLLVHRRASCCTAEGLSVGFPPWRGRQSPENLHGSGPR